MSTLSERITEERPKRMPMPTIRQMAAATEILERVQGDGARSQALAPFVADGVASLAERLDKAGLAEERVLAKLAEKLDATETQFFQKDGIVTDQRDVVAHGVQLKATRTALELRGLLSSRGGVSVAASGNCQVNVGLSWSPSPSQLPQSNDIPTDTHAQRASTGQGTSTSEGTGIGRGGAPHSRFTAKSVAGTVAIAIADMSEFQLKKYVPAAARRVELERRLKLRKKKNPRAAKLVGKSHKGQSNCKSGKCGRCNRCRLEKRRVATNPDGSGVYAK